MSIALWWIGVEAADETTIEEVRRQVEREFAEPVARARSDQRPDGTLDVRRGQHSSRGMLRWLVAAKPGQCDRVLGMTDVDLFIPVLTFVFGEAQLDGPAAVVSTARLSEGASREEAARRLVKECVHELGHTYGLVHCALPTCVMTRSPSVRAIDVKRAQLCPECRVRYQMVQKGLHVYREYTDPGRR